MEIKIKKNIVLLVFSLLSFFISQSTWAKSLTVTSLNIEWYGRGGNMKGSWEDEFRNPNISEFLKSSIPASDVYVFQEITEPEALKEVFFEKDCVSYSAWFGHQHIVICAPKGSIESSYPINGVKVGKKGLRPALLVEIKFEGKTYTIVGVHLKAGIKESNTRMAQVDQIIPEVTQRDRILIVGDFNTYNRYATKLKKDDSEMISERLSPYLLFGAPIKNYTYLGSRSRTFDRAWQKGLNLHSSQVYGPCSESSVEGLYSKFSFYKKHISDHCALQLVVE